MSDGTATPEKMTVSYKLKMCLPYDTAIAFSIYNQRNENVSVCKNLYANVHSHFISNSKKLEKIHMFFRELMTVVYPYHEISFSNKKWQSIDTHNNLMGFKGIVLSEKSQSQRLHMIPVIWMAFLI